MVPWPKRYLRGRWRPALDMGIRPNDITLMGIADPGEIRRSVFLGSEYDYFVQAGDRNPGQQSTLDATLVGGERGQRSGVEVSESPLLSSCREGPEIHDQFTKNRILLL